MNWKKYYKLPLQLDPEPYSSYAWTKDNNMALGFDRNTSRETAQTIIDVINGTQDYERIEGLTYDEEYFFQDGKYIFCVRGRGELIGVGGKNLPLKKAMEIRDGFAEFIFKKLGNE